MKCRILPISSPLLFLSRLKFKKGRGRISGIVWYFHQQLHTFHRGNEYDGDNSVVYYNSYDPNDRNREYSNLYPSFLPSPFTYYPLCVCCIGGDFTVGLYSQRSPYTDVTQREVDPNLGRHDDFLLLGPYIFAQRNDSGNIHLYISYLRNPFNRTKIPTNDAHQVR